MQNKSLNPVDKWEKMKNFMKYQMTFNTKLLMAVTVVFTQIRFTHGKTNTSYHEYTTHIPKMTMRRSIVQKKKRSNEGISIPIDNFTQMRQHHSIHRTFHSQAIFWPFWHPQHLEHQTLRQSVWSWGNKIRFQVLKPLLESDQPEPMLLWQSRTWGTWRPFH